MSCEEWSWVPLIFCARALPFFAVVCVCFWRPVLFSAIRNLVLSGPVLSVSACLCLSRSLPVHVVFVTWSLGGHVFFVGSTSVAFHGKHILTIRGFC